MNIVDLYIHCDRNNRIDGTMPGFLDNGEPNVNDQDIINGWQPWILKEELPEDWWNWLLIEDSLVYSIKQPTEEELQEQEFNTLMTNLPEIVADTDTALCEIYETQEQAQAETDAALCEIYEMLLNVIEGE